MLFWMILCKLVVFVFLVAGEVCESQEGAGRGYVPPRCPSSLLSRKWEGRERKGIFPWVQFVH